MARRSSPEGAGAARFALRSERVATPDGVRAAVVVVEGERIVAVTPGGEAPASVPVEDLGALVLFPGLVDGHVHLNEPGRADWEGFATGTRAAAAGGVTTLVDMPLNCSPVTTTARAFEAKAAAAAGQLWVDCGFWGGVVPGNAEDLEPLHAAGALGFKAFLIDSGLAEFPPVTPDGLAQVMPRIRATGAPLLVHAELDVGSRAANGTRIATLARDSDPREHAAHLRSRPRAWENAAVRCLIELARETRCPTHIVHLSSADSVEDLRRARDAGVPLTVETCPHYLVLAAEEVPDGDTRFKCAPPIREAANREALWRALAEGVIDSVVTDHSPCLPALKRRETGDFARAWGGVASLQLGLPAVWTEARRRGHGLDALARWLCAAPARLAGLGARKGAIAPGLDADLVAWDPDARFGVDAAALALRHPEASPYIGRALAGVVETTWLRGRVAYRRGRGGGSGRRVDRSAYGDPRGRLLRGRDC